VKESLLLLISICSLCHLSACGGGGITPPPGVATHFSVAPPTSTPTPETAWNFTVKQISQPGAVLWTLSMKLVQKLGLVTPNKFYSRVSLLIPWAAGLEEAS
jgi:hypothetical protein